MDVNLTVSPDGDQTFQAAGFSLTMNNPYATGMVDKGSAAFNDASFSELNAKLVRLWTGINASDFMRAYSTAADVAKAQGVSTFLWAPSLVNDGSIETERGWVSSGYINQKGIDEQPRFMANLLRQIHDAGIVHQATGQINEPGSANRTNVRPEDYVQYALSWRSALDNEGLQDIKLLGLEYQPPLGSTHIDYARLIAADPTAKAAIVGLASHTYDASPTEEVAQIARENNWEYWQTESGEHGNKSEAAAKYLSDLQYGVTHFVHFIGPHTGSGQNVLTWPGSPTNFMPSYWAFKLLWNAFIPGTMIHRVHSDEGGFMRWNRHSTVHVIYASAGIDPNGKWVVGISNVSGNPRNRWVAWPQPPRDVTVNLKLPIRGNATFAVSAARDGEVEAVNQVKDHDEVVATDGEATFAVRSRELVVLVQTDGGPPVPPPPPDPSPVIESIVKDLESVLDRVRNLGEPDKPDEQVLINLEAARHHLTGAGSNVAEAQALIDKALDGLKGES